MVKSTEFKNIIIKYLKLEDISADEIDDEDSLFSEEGLGLDSVDSIELILAIEQEYGIVFTDTKQYDTIFSSVNTLLTYINENKK